MRPKILIGLAHSYGILCDGLPLIYEGHPYIDIIFSVRNASELIKELDHRQPHILIIDTETTVLDGFRLLGHIMQKFPELKVIVFSEQFNATNVQSLIDAGARAVLPLTSSFELFEEAIFKVFESGFFYGNVKELA